MEKSDKIYVAGHHGLVGSAIWNNLLQRGYTNLVGRTHKELDLLDGVAVRQFFDQERPEAVVLAAAHVGGIMANLRYRADFIYQNLQIQQNVIGESYRHGVKKLLFLGSTCIYPRMAPQPMTEEALLTSELEYTNEPYAIAKIAGLKMCESFSLQYGCNYIAVMPTNLYGPNDTFHLERSHVLPAMIRKVHLARCLGEGNWQAVRSDLDARPVEGIEGTNATEAEILEVLQKYGIRPGEVTLWGTGTPLREFLWSEDMADASVHVLLNVDFKDTYEPSATEIRNCHINVGTGIEHTIRDVAQMVINAVGFEGTLLWDSTKPDGTPRKLCDTRLIRSLGWAPKIDLAAGLRRTVDEYRAEGVPVWMVMPQNEFNSDQVFPSCTWQAKSLAAITSRSWCAPRTSSGTARTPSASGCRLAATRAPSARKSKHGCPWLGRTDPPPMLESLLPREPATLSIPSHASPESTGVSTDDVSAVLRGETRRLGRKRRLPARCGRDRRSRM